MSATDRVVLARDLEELSKATRWFLLAGGDRIWVTAYSFRWRQKS